MICEQQSVRVRRVLSAVHHDRLFIKGFCGSLASVGYSLVERAERSDHNSMIRIDLKGRKVKP